MYISVVHKFRLSQISLVTNKVASWWLPKLSVVCTRLLWVGFGDKTSYAYAIKIADPQNFIQKITFLGSCSKPWKF